MNDSVWIPVIHSGNAASQMRFLWNMKLPINSRGDIPLVGYLMLDGWYHPLNTYHVLSKREFWAHGSVQPTNGPRHWADLWWMQRLLATQRWLGMFYREMKLFRIWIYTYQVSIYLFIHRSIHPSIYRKSSLYIRTITYIYGDVLCMIHAHPEVNTRLGTPGSEEPQPQPPSDALVTRGVRVYRRKRVTWHVASANGWFTTEKWDLPSGKLT